MCGICGIWQKKSTGGDLDRAVRNMAAALKHRGPDEEGFWIKESVALGHRRLKVIDLSSGRQPMSSADGRYALSFNGEIYNYREIRADLEKQGKCFTTSSDTESLLQLYEQKGIAALPDLKGMFAFAVYDSQKKSLTLAVDAFGKKPLYYFSNENVFLFASELKSLLAHPAVSRSIDPEALSEYLSFEYVPAPRTIFKGISKMEAGTSLTMAIDGRIDIRRYHEHHWAADDRLEGDWEADFEKLFLSAVEKRLVSDVPLGVFLSGGIDSSAVLWAVRKILPEKKIQTFTIEFDDKSFDEGPYASAVSQHFKTDHRTEKCSASRMLHEHESILATLDEPFADASYLPTYMLCRMARCHVTVALSGDGGDEVFCGYPTFKAHSMARAIDRWPRGLKSMASWGVNQLPVSMKNLSFDFKAKQFFKGIHYPPLVRDQIWLGAFSPEETAWLMDTGKKNTRTASLELITKHHWPSKTDSIQKLQEFYYRFYMQGDILVKSDRASMAHALEVRSPLLDDDLVAMVNRMPTKLKMQSGKLKGFLKKCLQGKVPDVVLNRPKKGFGIPVARWIRSELKDNFKETLSSKALAADGFFDPAAVQTLLNEHWQGHVDHRKKLWTLYVFQQWKKNWL